jgi:hypothetical protein
MGPADVVAGDFDGDDNVDVATANEDSDDVSVLLGAGDGSLGSATEYTVGTGPVRIVAGELSGDTRDDIATANGAGNNVSVLLANAGGGFDTVANYTVGTTPVDVALGDIAGGGTDIAVANSGSDNVSVLTNGGSGTFTVDGPYVTNGSPGGNTITPSAIAMGPIGENASFEDVWYGGANRFGASPGTGTGAINDGISIQGTAGTALARAGQGDANDDAFLDVVVTDTGGIFYLQNSAAGDAQYTATSLTAGTTPSDVVFARLTDDNDLDIVVSNAGSSDVTVLLGDGAGAFATTLTFDCGTATSGVAVADLDEDGLGDIICTSPNADEVTVLLGRTQ